MIIIDISFGFMCKEAKDKLTWELLNIGLDRAAGSVCVSNQGTIMFNTWKYLL